VFILWFLGLSGGVGGGILKLWLDGPIKSQLHCVLTIRSDVRSQRVSIWLCRF
jgi:hypothetical protein